MDEVIKWCMPSKSRTRRRQELRALKLGVLLGLLAAAVIGAGLYLLNVQGRI